MCPALEHALTPDPHTVEEPHEVRIAVRSAEAHEDTYTLAGAFFRFVQKLVKIVVNISGTFLPVKLSVLDDYVHALIDGIVLLVRKGSAENLMAGEAKKSVLTRPSPAKVNLFPFKSSKPETFGSPLVYITEKFNMTSLGSLVGKTIIPVPSVE